MRALILAVAVGLVLAPAAPSSPQTATPPRAGYGGYGGSQIMGPGQPSSGPSQAELEAMRQSLVQAGCLRPDERDLSRHDCYINHDGKLVHRPARDN